MNGLPYAYAWYLDIITEGNWDAIIVDDYAAVFPIPFKSRLVYRKAVQPFFAQQLGLFYTDKAHRDLLPEVIRAIPKKFRTIKLHLNAQNDGSVLSGRISARLTHHILLDRPFAEISAAYNEQILRNLKKAAKVPWQVVDVPDVEMLLHMRRKYLGPVLAGKQSEEDTLRLGKLLQEILNRKKGFIRTVTGPGGDVQAAVCMVESNGYLIYLSAVSSDIGKAQHAMTFLIDSILRQYAQSGLIFDFEGSMIPGLARYYKGFGGQEVWFPVLESRP